MQAAPRRQDRPGTIGFDRAALESPFDTTMRGGYEQVAGDQAADEAVVACRCELAAPASEAEIGEAWNPPGLLSVIGPESRNQVSSYSISTEPHPACVGTGSALSRIFVQRCRTCASAVQITTF